MAQSKQRFGELHNVCFNEENYPYDIFKYLEMFRSPQFRTTEIHEFPLDTKPENFLEYQNISNEIKQRFERNVSPIQPQNYNGISISFFTNPYIGDWYLKEIKDSSIVGYYNAIPRSGLYRWKESIYNLKYIESEIVYCIMKKLSKYYEQNSKFEIEFNKYKAFFDGTLEEFLECLINEYEDFKFYYLGWEYMNKIEGYGGLRRKLIEMVNNLSTHPTPNEIEQWNDTFDFDKEIDTLTKSENKFHKGLPMDFVINHFKVFYDNNRRTEYLSKERFVSFIKRGFLNDDSQPIQKINFNTRETGLVILRFYEFFDKAVREYNHPNKKANFINLILRCFDNLGTEKQVKSFLKPNKTTQVGKTFVRFVFLFARFVRKKNIPKNNRNIANVIKTTIVMEQQLLNILENTIRHFIIDNLINPFEIIVLIFPIAREINPVNISLLGLITNLIRPFFEFIKSYRQDKNVKSKSVSKSEFYFKFCLIFRKRKK